MTFEIITEKNYNNVATIYEQGIATGNATFQKNSLTWEDWDKCHNKFCRIVGIENNEIVGWAALTPVSNRNVYKGVAEVSVYVATNHRGKGFGKKLLEELILLSEQNELWTLQAGIFPENSASIKLHEYCGFRIIGIREKIGKMNDVWRDNLFLERRSKTIVVDNKKYLIK